MSKIATGLAERGHEVDFIVAENSGTTPAPQHCRFHTLCTKASHGWFGKHRLAWNLHRLIASWRYDIFISTLPFADEIAITACVPRHVCRIANTLGAEIDKISRHHPHKALRRLRRYQRFYGQRPLVAVSEGVAADLRSRIGSQSVITIPNPFDFAAIRAAAALTSDIPRQPFVLHVGRFSPQKRHDLLLDAWARITTPHMLLLMTEPNTQLEAMINERQLHDRVRIIGFQRNPYPWMARAELLVLCSDHEGMPNVLVEALICGTRVVSTDCPSGPREILIGPLSRWLTPPNDVVALANKITEALSAPPPQQSMISSLLQSYAHSNVLLAWERLAREADLCAAY